MVAQFVVLAQDVEMERLNLVKQSFVVQEDLCYVAEVFAVNLLSSSVHLEHRDFVVSVDLVTRRVSNLALLLVSFEFLFVHMEH